MQSTALPGARAGLVLACGAVLALGACEGGFDPDLRGLGDGFSTTEAARNAAPRPEPDSRGIITYPNYQVVVARPGDTARAIGLRLGLNAEEFARYNGISPDSALRPGEVLALPVRVGGSEPAPAPDLAARAGAAIDRAGNVTTTPLSPAASASPQPAPAAAVGAEPIRHQVRRGETAYSIARLYGASVTAIAEWNGLGPDLAVREGQQLLVPQDGAGAAPGSVALTEPGAGSPTPVPPSAATPLPEEVPPPADTPAVAPGEETVAPDLGAEQSPAPAARFIMPLQGAIIRDYVRGRNDGIDISAAAGTEVRAAAGGTVAAVTTNTEGVEIVVIRHSDGLLSVYTHVTDLTIAKDQSVNQGQVIGRVRPGEPAFVHFEIRRGMESLDPNSLLPGGG